VFKASTKDNPYLSPEFVASLEQAYTGDFARQELYGEFVSFEGLVYDEFSRDVHVVDSVPDRLSNWIVGADEGYTNPTVLLAVGFDGDGRAYIVSEWYMRQVLQDEVLDEAWQLHKAYHPVFKVDPSAAGMIAAMGQRGILAEGARTEVMDGIRQVKARLARAGDGKPRLFVHSSCVNTIAEFESYCWKKVRDSYTDQPEKQNDHAMDSVRYALAEHRPVQLQEEKQLVGGSRWTDYEGGSRWR
jgi:phage terminase large subunit